MERSDVPRFTFKLEAVLEHLKQAELQRQCDVAAAQRGRVRTAGGTNISNHPTQWRGSM